MSWSYTEYRVQVGTSLWQAGGCGEVTACLRSIPWTGRSPHRAFGILSLSGNIICNSSDQSLLGVIRNEVCKKQIHAPSSRDCSPLPLPCHKCVHTTHPTPCDFLFRGMWSSSGLGPGPVIGGVLRATTWAGRGSRMGFRSVSRSQAVPRNTSADPEQHQCELCGSTHTWMFPVNAVQNCKCLLVIVFFCLHCKNT